MVDRNLVLTAIESTWPEGLQKPVVFLGEWCRLYSRKERWSKMKAKVLDYHWDDRKKYFKDYVFLKNIHEKLLNELSKKLNKIHKIKRSKRYWRFIIGPWLGYFVQILFDRWFMLKQAHKKNKRLQVKVVYRKKQLIPNDMTEFLEWMAQDDWNEALYGEILKKIKFKNFSIKKIHCQNSLPSKKTYFFQKTLKQKAKEIIQESCNRLASWTSSKRSHFFMSPYISFFQNFWLQCQLSQVPQFWKTVKTPKTRSTSSFRNWRLEDCDKTKNFIGLAKRLIPLHMPTVYLEGFRASRRMIRKLAWPDSPQSIFDSVGWCGNDIFKIWAAEKCETGTPFIIGQHGGSYGVSKWSFGESHQISVSDIFLSWGWKNKKAANIVPVGNLKNGKKHFRWGANTHAILVGNAMPRYSYYSYSAPVAAGQWLEYFDEQCRFVENLSEELRAKLIIRLYACDYDLCQKQRWADRFPSLRIDDGIQPMDRLLHKTRIYISTYNATTYLDSMLLNIPTLIFWNPKHWEIRDETKKEFEALTRVKIFHSTPESAANQLSQVWGCTSEWWLDKKVQKARNAFCRRFSFAPEKPTHRLLKVFREISSKKVHR